MNQIQCVPRWGVEHVTPVPRVPPLPPPPPPTTTRSHSHSDISLQDYEVTELTWENGQLMMHGLGLPRVYSKSNLASGTLESIVNQATQYPPSRAGECKKDNDLDPLFDSRTPSVSMSMDALVPTANNGGCSTRVGSCSVAMPRVPTGSDWSVSLSESDRMTRQQVSGGVNGVTSTSFGLSLDNTKTVDVTGGDEHDSVCHSRPQKARGREEEEDENKKKGNKRSRAAVIHNQSERKRRDKINQRMKTLQKMVPNSSKTDKSSMLDEVIDYVKQLQAQVHMMSRMNIPTAMMMNMPIPIQQQLQMSIMSQMGMGMGMMGMGMDHMNNFVQPNNVIGISNPVGLIPSAFVPCVTWDGVSAGGPTTSINGERVSSYNPTMLPSDPLSTYLACQQTQPMTMDAYSKMASMYQRLHQQQQLGHISNI